MLDDFGQRIRDIILSEMDLSRELSDEEICDLIGSVVSREARDRPMTIKDRAELERTIFNSLRKLDVLQELVDDRDVTEIKGVCEMLEKESEDAFDERRLLALKLGEEAGTKMLMPMMIMMAIVIAIVIAPAIIDFKI